MYRFEKISRFEELVNEQALTFVLPDLWPDRNEGFLFRAVQSEDGMRKVREALKQINPASDGFEIALLKVFRRSRYAQCWSSCPENDALWKGYEVRIEADRDDVPRLDGVKAYDVRYVDSIRLEDELKSLFVYPGGGRLRWKSEDVLLIKRNQFSHEQEVRLLTKPILENVTDKNPPWAVAALIEVFRREYEQGKMTKEEFERRADNLVKSMTVPRIKKVSIAQVPGFIKSVMLHPFAPDEIDKRIAHFCSEHSLNYVGKSRMYEFNI